MKEVSIEEKEYNGNYKVYTELINRLEDVKEAIKKQNYGIATDVLCKPYPNFQVTTHSELKESEGENIRKALIDVLNSDFEKDTEIHGITVGTIITWLEKQGRKDVMDINQSEFESSLNTLLKQFEKLPKEELASSLSFYLNVVQNNEIYKDEENQGEQKVSVVDFKAKDWYVSEVDGKIHNIYHSADTVEPKFKVGDWIIHNKNTKLANSLMLVTSKDNNKYLCKYKDGQCSYNIEFIDKEYRLWTIEDAKDGDVLYSLDSNQPFIYRGRNIHEQATAYCGINKYGNFFVWNTKDCIITLDKYIPSTKEQRNLLFQKIKEAGYEWDAEKKELK